MSVTAASTPRRLVRLRDARVAELTGHAPLSSLYDMARAEPPRLPGIVKIGRRVLVDLDQLEAWIDRGGDRSRNRA